MSLESDSIGARIRAMRADMTQADFAARLGVDRKTVVRWEADERVPDGASLLALWHEFGGDVLYVLTGQRAGTAAPVAPLKPEHIALIDNYDHCSLDDQAAIRRLASTAAQPRAKARARR